LNMSPSLAIAAASEPSLHCESRFVVGSACTALGDNSARVNGTAATATVAECIKFMGVGIILSSGPILLGSASNS
jgi:hypothetical protein